MRSLRTIQKMVKAQKIVLHKRFDGMPKESDFKIVTEELPPLNNEEFLAEAVYLSVDPYMRAYAHNLPEGSIMIGTQVAKVIESKNEKYPVGSYIFGKFDWRSHTISSGKGNKVAGAGYAPVPYILNDFDKFPLSYALGILGMPGLTAYFGFLDGCKPNPGETVLVTGAAGAVGSIVGQIAKIKGCNVIGVTGSNDKGRYLVEELGFDHFINYKTDNVDEKLAEIAPEGVDCYFDNVAGELSSTIIKHMSEYGRISVCGSISTYNMDYVNNPLKVTPILPYILFNQLVMQGFQSYLYQDRFNESFQELFKWLQEGRIKYMETVTEGFENMGKAFIEMLGGKNLGKAVVKV